MKKGLIIWNVLLSLVVGYLIFSKFSNTSGKNHGKKEMTGDSVRNDHRFRMAYFEMDSVAANFELVKEVKAELAKKENDINAEMDRRTKDFQQRFNFLQNKAQSGGMTQPEIESATAEVEKLKNDLNSRKQQLDGEYNDLMLRKQNDIKNKIEGYLKEYNKTKNYSYIISYEQGLFYYKDTAFNITADIIKGLNQYYKTGKTN